MQRGIGKHLAASYPYSAGIGVGAVAYFIPKGILRPTILKWASAPRFLFLFMPPGCGWRKKSNVFMEKEKKVYSDDRGGQTIIVNQSERKRSNGLGTAGFVLALLGLIFSWVPGLGWVLWLLGLIFSFVGIFRAPRGLAIAGLVMSCIALIILIVVVGAIGSLIAVI